ncbi:allatostatins [Athalia rosae]|uniref:allatostatins n=1 Tax=Athalia rosae TaxID=37344 RepID=UPI0006250B5E|nr:allatostatins [Athalia rosae]
MRSLALALACSWLLGFIRPSLTMQEAPSSAPLQLSSSGNVELEPEVDPETLLQGLEFQGNPGKRAYTYVSEYKRLPIYNFGLGKRWSISGGSNTVDEDKRARLYSFGLGKRARPYSFGLGKRADDSSASTLSSPSSSSFGFRGQPDLEELSRDPLEDYLEKRSRQLYSFGLGKRMAGDERGDYGQRFNFGLGKRPSEDYGHRYKFGLGKRRLLVNDNRISPSDDEEEQQEPALAS